MENLHSYNNIVGLIIAGVLYTNQVKFKF